MPDKSVPPTLLIGLFTGLLAGIMQLATLTLLALKLRAPQMAAAFVFSTVLGGIVTVLLIEQLKWPPFIAGSLGSASGMAPAIIVPFLALRGVLKRLDMGDAEALEMVNRFARPAQPAPEEVKPDGPTEP